MTFVNEKISDEDREKYGIEKAADRWVVDRENGIFFVYTGAADYGRVLFYELNLNGQIIKISTERLISEKYDQMRGKNISDITYNIEKIQIPENVNLSFDNLNELITKAFKKSGLFGREDYASSVTVNFPEKITKYNQESSVGRVI
jgi:hypothetical protein